MSDYKVLHRVIRRIAGWSIWAFFTEVHVIGEENVPKDGPLIVAATHHNMMIDPAVLSSAFPHRRILNYWTKATLFANPVLKQILLSSGNIPVDRKSKDNQVLFKGTFEALANNQAVALFPEGTSYTEPRIMQVKDGAAWSALEYMKWAKQNPHKTKSQDIVVVTAGIVYTNKSKYRSNVIMEFGPPIHMKDYEEQFLSDVEGSPRGAVKRLTHTIESQLLQSTINAPDWDTLYAARMARDLLWEDENAINLDDFVSISQTLVDLFSTTDATPNLHSAKKRLLEYYSLLQSARLSNPVLSTLPLPRTLDPRHPAPLPSRLLTVSILVRDSISLLVRLPFFLFPLMIHFPAYIMGKVGALLVEDEEETQAQNKVLFGLLFLLMIYTAAFFFLWAFLWYTPTGALAAAGIVYLFAIYHVKLVNDTYEHAKRVIAAWRVLVGVWVPKRWDLSMETLKQYTTPLIPPENPWIDRPKTDPASTPPASASPSIKSHRKRRPPSRQLIRHVLRARSEAVQALVVFFDQLEKPGDKRVRASAHLAHAYGGKVEADTHHQTKEGIAPVREAPGWRYASEVIQFLRDRGAKIATLQHRIDGDWAALSSEGEGDSDAGVDSEDLKWVPTGHNSDVRQ